MQRKRDHVANTVAIPAPPSTQSGQPLPAGRRTVLWGAPSSRQQAVSPVSQPFRTALIVAAGRSQRFGGEIPKQYQSLLGQPILRRSVLAYLRHPAIAAVRVVIQPDYRDLYEAAVGDLGLAEPVAGGETRQRSVLNGLEALAGDTPPPDQVLIHDGARPLTDAATIAHVAAALDEVPGAIAAIPVVDTLKRQDPDGDAHATVDRRGFWRAQTPQGFRFAPILQAHRAAAHLDLTDDAAVAEHAGLAVRLVEASEDNIKVTHESDLARAARILGATPETRVGSGFDVHRFGPGDAVRLCGLDIPHSHGLDGHSDADVALHALTDALYGALADGDIGSHFPPSEAAWRGADSAIFLKDAVDRVAGRGGRIVHVDVTVICQEPKVGPHRDAMTGRLAELLGIARDRIGVKATTTERLGFTGRGEGIAAMASATIELPRT
ncbi:MAG: bifunctional 2-C-methyl-D-erythritol 4-phosphate cytidylyltransferase/2-C-methyl-D-erythritol 2,4-cyclodiphosphate synthase [Rhodospirillaceae bacterium]|nr:bifunctional 2-C-methyl-D-erythritol 4-phosphate cytidylyltransferase/2-C-methyl-D-erythritol 2,4-cyclodiphosphate synthase [Rhodospirillaceae bacterium]